jgi:hypothetical protein
MEVINVLSRSKCKGAILSLAQRMSKLGTGGVGWLAQLLVMVV